MNYADHFNSARTWQTTLYIAGDSMGVLMFSLLTHWKLQTAEYLFVLLGVLMAVLLLCDTLFRATIRVRIDGQGVSQAHLFGSRSTAWEDVTEIHAHPTGYGAYLVVLLLKQKRPHGLLIPYVGNPVRTAREICRRGLQANPAIVLKGRAFGLALDAST